MVVARGIARVMARNIRLAALEGNLSLAQAHLGKCSGSPSAQRLASHVFIHSMLRFAPVSIKFLKRTNSEVIRIVDAGIRVHPRTMAAHVQRMLQYAHTSPSESSKHGSQRSSIVILEPWKAHNAILRATLFLFLKTRQTFHIWTQGLHVSLVTTLLKQREYLAATLLFDRVAQDHALLLALPSAVKAAQMSGSSHYESLKNRLDHLKAENPVPDLVSLTLITDRLKKMLQKYNPVFTDNCIQSAVILGALLDRDQLPEGGKPIVISLLRALIHSPTLDILNGERGLNVYVDVYPKPISVNAVTYVRHILKEHDLANRGKMDVPLEMLNTKSQQDTTIDTSSSVAQS